PSGFTSATTMTQKSAIWIQPTKVIVVRLSEMLRTEQRVDEIDQQPERHDCGERIVESHDPSSSEPVAGVAIPDRQHEEPEPYGQHDDVHHLGAPTKRNTSPG